MHARTDFGRRAVEFDFAGLDPLLEHAARAEAGVRQHLVQAFFQGGASLSARTRADSDAPTLEERLHKVLANAGLGSRRMLEQRIASGEVWSTATPPRSASSVQGGDRVELDGKQFVVATDNARHRRC